MGADADRALTRRRRALGAGAVALALFSLAPQLAEHVRLCDVVSSFAPQRLAAAVLLVALAARARARRPLAVLVAVCALELLRVAPYAPTASSVEADWTVCLFNVRKKNAQHADVLRFVRTEQPDLLVLLEVDRRWADAMQPLAEGRHVALSSTLGSGGIMVVGRQPFAVREVHLTPHSRPNLILSIDRQGAPLTVVCAHPQSPTSRPGKWEDRNLHLRRLAELVRGQPGDVVLAADLNTGPWSPHYARLLERAELRDSRVGRGLRPTWPVPLALLTGVPIDHVLHTGGLRVAGCRTGPNLGSDHLPLIVGFR